MRDEPDAGQEERHHRQLEGDAEGEQHARGEGQVLADADLRRDADRGELLEEEAERDREDEPVAERRAARRRRTTAAIENGQRDALLALVEPGRDELPDLVEDDRAGDEDAGDDRHLELGEERVGDAGADDERLLGRIAASGAQQERRPGARTSQ